MQKFTASIESLESRRLMSASPFDAAVQADRLQVRIDLLHLSSDFYGDAAKLLTDNRALKANHLSANLTLHPLAVKMRSDVASFDLTLKEDRLTEASNVLSDESVVLVEKKQMLLDRKNATALAADKTQLTTDRIKLQDDMVAGLTQRIDDREAGITTIMADSQAILTALPTSGANTALTAAVSLWLSDKGTALDKITTDLTKVSEDRAKLITDLTVENA